MTINLYRENFNRKLDLYGNTQTDQRGRYLFVPENGIYSLALTLPDRELILKSHIQVTDKKPRINKLLYF